MSLYSFPLLPLSFYECIILRNTVKIVTIKNYSNKEWTSCCDVFGLNSFLVKVKHDLSDVGGDRYISQYYFLEISVSAFITADK